MLRTSLDGPVRLSALSYLATMTLTRFDPALVIHCFDILGGCVKITDGKATIAQGMEQLATVSAMCCLHTLSHLTITDPVTSIEDLRQRYTEAYPPETNFDALPFSHTLWVIHSIFYKTPKLRVVLPTRADKMTLITWRARYARRVQWGEYKPSSGEYTITAHSLAKLSRFEYRRRGNRKVPRWLLRFAFHSLSKSPPPPTSAVASCLSIVATDLRCSFSDTTTPNKR